MENLETLKKIIDERIDSVLKDNFDIKEILTSILYYIKTDVEEKIIKEVENKNNKNIFI